MRRDGVDYIRCLGCDQVFEDGDLSERDAIPVDDEASVPIVPDRHRRKRAS